LPGTALTYEYISRGWGHLVGPQLDPLVRFP
jgi:hypothetical protein